MTFQSGFNTEKNHEKNNISNIADKDSFSYNKLLYWKNSKNKFERNENMNNNTSNANNFNNNEISIQLIKEDLSLSNSHLIYDQLDKKSSISTTYTGKHQIKQMKIQGNKISNDYINVTGELNGLFTSNVNHESSDNNNINMNKKKIMRNKNIIRKRTSINSIDKEVSNVTNSNSKSISTKIFIDNNTKYISNINFHPQDDTFNQMQVKSTSNNIADQNNNFNKFNNLRMKNSLNNYLSNLSPNAIDNGSRNTNRESKENKFDITLNSFKDLKNIHESIVYIFPLLIIIKIILLGSFSNINRIHLSIIFKKSFFIN